MYRPHKHRIVQKDEPKQALEFHWWIDRIWNRMRKKYNFPFSISTHCMVCKYVTDDKNININNLNSSTTVTHNTEWAYSFNVKTHSFSLLRSVNVLLLENKMWGHWETGERTYHLRVPTTHLLQLDTPAASCRKHSDPSGARAVADWQAVALVITNTLLLHSILWHVLKCW